MPNLPIPPFHQRFASLAATRWRYPLALIAGWLVAMAMEPVAAPIAGIAGLALFIALLGTRPPSESLRLGLAFGLAHFAAGLSWIAQAFSFQSSMPAAMGIVAVFGLAAFLALYPAIAAYAARRLTGRIVPLTFLLAGLFTLTEILRGTLFTGFAWHPLGAAFLPLPIISGLAAHIGANGLSAILILTGGAVATLILAPRSPGAPILFAAILAIALSGKLTQPPRSGQPASGPTFLLVQTGTSIADKNAPGGLERSLSAAIAQSRAALPGNPTAIIWPEATVEFPMEEMPILRRQLTQDFAPQTLLVTGGVALERGADGMISGARNSFYALDYQGNILARYDKSHLVPGGEYLPLRAIAEPLGLARLVPGTLDFLPGDGPVTWNLPGLPALSPNICYEIIFPAAVVKRDHRPQAIITISNDAWFGDHGPPQHHAQARLRALEEGLPILRVTPTGLTGLIGPDGAMLATLPRGAAATLSVRLPAPRPVTLFARFGLIAPGVFALLLIAVGYALHRRKT